MCPNHNRPLGLIYLAVVSWTVQAATASAADAGAGLASAPPEVSLVAPRGLEMAQTSSADAIAPWSWQIRPRGFVYDTYWAGAAEPRLGTQLVDESDGGPFLDSQVGGRVGMLRYGPADRPEGFQVDVLGGAKLRQDWDGNLDVLATDYRYDILGTYGAGPHRWKFGFYHISSHVGDEFLLRNRQFQRLNYSRDTLVAGYSYYPLPCVRLYAEMGWAFDHDVSQPWHFQFGIDCGPRQPTGLHGAPFFAANVHLREELDFGGNLAVQAGWAWRGDDPLDGLLRTGLYFYEGGSPHFSFYAEHERQLGWGLWYDY
jgi:hypothetical protein